jgi:SAM-dependent methyltransferase
MTRLSLSEFAALPAPEPWHDADNIPWNEPGFSRRMLAEHLNPNHDAASRRPDTIDAHVEWIHREVLREVPSSILDLGCGPGLYTSRLARLGHTCVGIDYSPASIEYAREVASRERLRCEHRCEDIRAADYGAGHGLVMLNSGELNVFRPEEARQIVGKARKSLVEDGALLLETHTEADVRQKGAAGRIWFARESSVFHDEPHVWLEERAWHEDTCTAAVRFGVISSPEDGVAVFGQTFQAYSEQGYRELVGECGFGSVSFQPSLTGEATDEASSFLVIVAKDLDRS